MGESGGCFYIVRRCQPEVHKAWDITIYQIPSTSSNLIWTEWTIQIPFRPNAVAVDPQQDLLVIVQRCLRWFFLCVTTEIGLYVTARVILSESFTCTGCRPGRC
ncbi:hypothetical protein BDQ17DRAFT_1361319 [Cyathus striatus]|nr:hypothetical protein BDQ17DRAFT_1361319 [Cyathus striatus]